MKRRFAVILGFLILGAIINIAVAWGLAAWGPISDGVFRKWSADPTIVDWAKQSPLDFHNWMTINGYSFSYLDPPQAIVARTTGMEVVSLMSDRRDERRRPDGTWYLWQSYRIRCGWPVPALESVRWLRAGDRQFQTEHGVELPQVNRSPAQERWNQYASTRLLPWWPVWPAFLLNTIFYAIVCWLFLAAPLALRRTLRRRRWLCPTCAYPIGTSERCTECGAAVRPNP